ncbi:PREDICTED: uncharacterized protein LOC108544047 [Rhinopithecus bieti]|uniref:uncharacterized protein LOC108544047 n=1 Tax=Rhinopithecus bieti TaxID=61621 RepID=UPI00083C3E76|nr:PREDICTED: uncharacterized protein LOC108544047 [Rhinopithecus bieti]
MERREEAPRAVCRLISDSPCEPPASRSPGRPAPPVAAGRQRAQTSSWIPHTDVCPDSSSEHRPHLGSHTLLCVLIPAQSTDLILDPIPCCVSWFHLRAQTSS